MALFSLSVPKRFSLCLLLLFFALTLGVYGCSSGPAEEVKVSKRMKIEHTKKAPVKKAPKKIVKKVEKKPIKTAKPDVKWVSPRKATIKRKSVKKAAPKKAAPVKKTTVAKKNGSLSSTTQSGTNYVVSLSSFTERNKATTLVKKLVSDGYNAYVTESLIKGTTWYRVRCCFFEGYTEATKVKDKLAKQYFSKGAWVDKPTKAEVAEHAK